MSTNINITVDKTRLLDQVRLQQAASRESQVEKEREKRTTNRAAAARSKRLESEGLDENGKPKLGFSTNTLDIDRRFGANRRSVGNLAHVWLLGDKYELPGEPGVIETGAPGSDPGVFNWPVWKGSRTGNYATSSTQNNVLIGSGNGSGWVTFEDKGNQDLPTLPVDVFNPQPPAGSFTSSEDYFLYWKGDRYSMHPITIGQQEIKFAIPCGNKSFILIYGYTSAWHVSKTYARYVVRGWYSAGGGFLGFEQRDPVTGQLLPGVYSSEVPDWVRGVTAFGDLGSPPAGTEFDEDGTVLYNNGVWNFESFRGKSRKIKAYACSNDSVREISIPEKLQEIIDIAYPDAVDTTAALQYRENYIPYPSYEIPPGPSGGGIYGDKGLKAANNQGSVFTPEVFERLNTVKSFTSPESIRQFPPPLSWVMYDTSDGSYEYYQDTTPDIFETPTYWSEIYREGLPFYHAYWIEKNQEPNYEIYDPDYVTDWVDLPRPRRVQRLTLILSSDRTARDGAGDRGSNSYWGEDFITVWDWNDPNYCRSMCLSLGFTSSDLRA